MERKGEGKDLSGLFRVKALWCGFPRVPYGTPRRGVSLTRGWQLSEGAALTHFRSQPTGCLPTRSPLGCTQASQSSLPNSSFPYPRSSLPFLNSHPFVSPNLVESNHSQLISVHCLVNSVCFSPFVDSQLVFPQPLPPPPSVPLCLWRYCS